LFFISCIYVCSIFGYYGRFESLVLHAYHLDGLFGSGLLV
jgi:hypothetical protein